MVLENETGWEGGAPLVQKQPGTRLTETALFCVAVRGLLELATAAATQAATVPAELLPGGRLMPVLELLETILEEVSEHGSKFATITIPAHSSR